MEFHPIKSLAFPRTEPSCKTPGWLVLQHPSINFSESLWALAIISSCCLTHRVTWKFVIWAGFLISVSWKSCSYGPPNIDFTALYRYLSLIDFYRCLLYKYLPVCELIEEPTLQWSGTPSEWVYHPTHHPIKPCMIFIGFLVWVFLFPSQSPQSI